METLLQNNAIHTCSSRRWYNFHLIVNSNTNESPTKLYLFNIIPTIPYQRLSISPLHAILLCLTILCTSCVLYLWWKRHQTYRKLVDSGLPTVFWRPKFITYTCTDDELTNESVLKIATTTTTTKTIEVENPLYDDKLSSSTITNILPRMERLHGPYGMYGTVYGISTPVVHIAHPIPASAILSATIAVSSSSSPRLSNDNKERRRSTLSSKFLSSPSVTKEPAYNHFKHFCGEGVFTADGDDWKAKRSAVMHALLRPAAGNSNTGGCYQSKVEHHANATATHLLNDLQAFITKTDRNNAATQVTNETKTVNIVPILQRATIGLIYRYITHADLPNDSNNTHDNKMEREASSSPIPRSNEKTSDQEQKISLYLRSITRIRMIILAQSRSVWFLLPRRLYRTFSSLYRMEEDTMGPIRDMAQQACRDATTNPSSPLALLQNSNLYKSTTMTTTPNFSKNLIDEAITLLFAGQDTSAATLSWTLHLLSIYPEIQTKLANEIHQVFHEEYSTTNKKNNSDYDNDDLLITKKMISRMPYLDAVIKESMRLYPVAPFVVRKLNHPVQVPSSKPEEEESEQSTVLPSGTFACIWIYSLHRNPKFWHRPNDFVPERWLLNDDVTNGSGIPDKGISDGAYMPFALGPRNCVGQPLAQIILRTLLAKLIHRYEFRDPRFAEKLPNVDDRKIYLKDMQAGFTVLPKNGVLLSIHERTVV